MNSTEDRTAWIQGQINDNKILQISEFTHTGDKGAGVTEGYIATKPTVVGEGAAVETFMVKTFINHTLTKDAINARAERFKQSFIELSKRAQLVLPFETRQTDEIFTKEAETTTNVLLLYPDEMTVNDLIRECVAGDLYRLLLVGRAPEIRLVTGASVEIGLTSKFLDGFKTHLESREAGTVSGEGFESILAAQILLGESDIINTANFGTMLEGDKRVFAKIDHGKSFTRYFKGQQTLNNVLISLYVHGIEIDTHKLRGELNGMKDILQLNKSKTDALIDVRVKALSKVLDHNRSYTIIYNVAEDKFVMPRRVNTEITLELGTVTISSIEFNYDLFQDTFVDGSGETLENYFKTRLTMQINAANQLPCLNIFNEYKKINTENKLTALEAPLHNLSNATKASALIIVIFALITSAILTQIIYTKSAVILKDSLRYKICLILLITFVVILFLIAMVYAIGAGIIHIKTKEEKGVINEEIKKIYANIKEEEGIYSDQQKARDLERERTKEHQSAKPTVAGDEAMSSEENLVIASDDKVTSSILSEPKAEAVHDKQEDLGALA